MSKKSYRPHAETLDIRLQRLADALMSKGKTNGADIAKQALGAVIELKALANRAESAAGYLRALLGKSESETNQDLELLETAIAEARKALK